MSIARRIKSAESRLPKPPKSDAEKLRRRLSSTGEAAFFAGIFGGYSDHLAAAGCFQRGDRDGAVAIAELVDKRTDGVAGVAFIRRFCALRDLKISAAGAGSSEFTAMG
jgi:hypothetical protein